MQHEVAVTGVGLVSSLGNSHHDVIQKIMNGRSGITAVPHWAKYGVESLIAGTVDADISDLDVAFSMPGIRQVTTGPVLYNAVATSDALKDAGLGTAELETASIACLLGSSTLNVSEIFQDHRNFFSNDKPVRYPHTIFHYMGSTSAAVVSNLFGIRGPQFSVSAACAGSAHSIGVGFQLVRNGAVDCAIVGGGDEVNELVGLSFQALRTVLSTKYNATPQRASRPFDVSRDGFVLSGGSGVIVLERKSHAVARGRAVRGYVVGYGATSDAFDMFRPLPDGAQISQCMKLALADANVPAGEIGYINAHATSTSLGDLIEAHAIREVFGDCTPIVSSTKSMTGHSNGACGAHEAIFTLAALEAKMAPPSINIECVEPEIADMRIVSDPTAFKQEYALSNSFGLGGSNVSLVFGSA